jgi:hypothetical protein
MTPRSIILCLTLSFIGITVVNATHLRSGEIVVKQDRINIFTVKITVTVFTNTSNSDVLFGGEDDWLDFGDGTKVLIPITPNTPRPDLGEGVAVASYVTYHTYADSGDYLINYSEPNRNEGIINMSNSVATRFYIETMIGLRPNQLYKTPTSYLPQIHVAGQGHQLTLSMAYSDSIGNRLIYEKVVPKKAMEVDVDNYRFPENYSINEANGLITWDTKFQQMDLTGEYAFAVKITQVTGDGKIAGYVVRDFQIILIDAKPPVITDNRDLDADNRIYFHADHGTQILVVADNNARTQVFLTAYSELSNVSEAFRFSTYDSINSTGAPLKVGRLELRNTNSIRREAPYPITVRANVNENGSILTSDISYLFFTTDVPTKVNIIPPAVEPPLVTGIEREFKNSLAVYPNPFKNSFVIESDYSSAVKYTLTNMHGVKVCEGWLADEQTDASELSPGVYFLMVREGKKSSILKVIKR